jgi:uncharacterized protein (DUF2141 family)
MTIFFQRKNLALIAALTISTHIFSKEALAADLTIVVTNIQKDDGEIFLGLFANSPSDFPKTIVQGLNASAKNRDAQGRISLVFRSLPPGDYAVSAYQDLNGDKKLTTNFLKLPVEPYGFSNNARGTMGPPSFKDAAIKLGEENLTVELEIK